MPIRKNIRLSWFDYSAGWSFFVTICIQDREQILGYIDEDKNNHLNHFWKIAEEWLQNIPNIYRNTQLWSYVIMPDHIHFVVNIQHTENLSLSQIVKWYKQSVGKNIRIIKPNFIRQKWYYEHIIRDEVDLVRIEEYIYNNPINQKT